MFITDNFLKCVHVILWQEVCQSDCQIKNQVHDALATPHPISEGIYLFNVELLHFKSYLASIKLEHLFLNYSI